MHPLQNLIGGELPRALLIQVPSLIGFLHSYLHTFGLWGCAILREREKRGKKFNPWAERESLKCWA